MKLTLILSTNALVKLWQDSEEIKIKRSIHRNSYADKAQVLLLNFEVLTTVAQQSMKSQLSAVAAKVNARLYSGHLRVRTSLSAVSLVICSPARIAVCNTWSSGGTTLCRVGGATSQLDLPSLMPLSIAGCG